MSLSALNARMTVTNTVAVPAVVASNVIGLVLDNLYDLLTNAGGAFPNYADGTPRTPGSYPNEVSGSPSPVITRGTGSVWTWSREVVGGKTVAIIGAPPSSATSFCQNTRIVIAGDEAGSTPAKRATLGSPDNAEPNGIWIGLVKNVLTGNTYNGWADISPWTGCLFGGYTRYGTRTTNGSFYNANTIVRVIETQETCWFQITSGATAQNTHGAMGGAAIDPETSDGIDAETDGRVYFVAHSGGDNFGLSADWMLATNTASQMFFDGGGTGYSHSYSYTPGTANVVVCNRVYNSNATNISLVTRTGKFPRLAVYMANTGNWAGRLREVQIVRDGLSQQTFSTGGTINGFTFGKNPNNTGDCLLLQY